MRHSLDYPLTQNAAVFRTQLGWVVALWHNGVLVSLSFGDQSERAARARSPLHRDVVTTLEPAMQDVVARVTRYAEGEPVDFRDVVVDTNECTPFQRAVLHQCRRIPYGCVLTYAELATKAGYPQAARAVGNVMAGNKVPLIIPCHRVVGSGGSLGGFSAPDGVDMKRRLLRIEGMDV